MQRTIDQLIYDFIQLAKDQQLLDPINETYAFNRLLHYLNVAPTKSKWALMDGSESLLEVRDALVEEAVRNKMIANTNEARDQFGALLMDVVTPSPKEINQNFWEQYANAPCSATDAFFALSKAVDQLKTRELSRNEQYVIHSVYGPMEVTINLSKPEKSTKDIIQAQKKSEAYPSCPLCMTNEGFYGGNGTPGRANHRIIQMELNGKPWGFHYSPYGYYPEHCIVLSKEHKPMNINETTIDDLLAFVELFPHYFLGSNAGLPIVGGSLLGHEHYQGGQYTFPMEKARVINTYQMEQFPTVQVERLHWPLAVIRLQSESLEEIRSAGVFWMREWEKYENLELGIVDRTGEVRHNAVTLIARRKGLAYELDIVLRNNRVSEEYPDGIFHPHQEVHHIKKENIGLIEVLGLGILPPRLKEELALVQQAVNGEVVDVPSYQEDFVRELRSAYQSITEQELQEAVGRKFVQALEDAGVFKQDEEGQRAFQSFIEEHAN